MGIANHISGLSESSLPYKFVKFNLFYVSSSLSHEFLRRCTTHDQKLYSALFDGYTHTIINQANMSICVKNNGLNA